MSSPSDVCNVNDFKTFADIKTLINADESTLEIRADNQSQTEDKFIAALREQLEEIKKMEMILLVAIICQQ